MGFNLPWDELVLKERAEKGPTWFLTRNSFYESLKFNQNIVIPMEGAPSLNPGYTIPKKEFLADSGVSLSDGELVADIAQTKD
jgi:hypothetical protein